MESARKFANEIDQARGVDILGMVEARDREVRASTLREAATYVDAIVGSQDGMVWQLEQMAERAERGES